jgi:CRP-like cAMP-binding protein
MEQILQAQIARLVDFNPEEWAFFYSKLTKKQLAKKEHLLMEGDHCRHLAFITKGLMYYYLLDDGEMKVGQFFFEGQWSADFYSFIAQKPSKINIVTLEDTELLLLSHHDLQVLYRELPKTERLGRLIIEHIYVAAHQRNNSFLSESPEVRYRNLVNERPKVVERVPQYLVASYLGIQPESLSRIRKKIFDHKHLS